MTPYLRSFLILSFSTLGVAACANAPRGAFDSRDGWREGRIERIVPYGSLVTHPGTDCAAMLGVGPASPVAIVRYRHHSDFGSGVVPISESAAWAAGDRVYLQPDRCDAPLTRRPLEKP